MKCTCQHTDLVTALTLLTKAVPKPRQYSDTRFAASMRLHARRGVVELLHTDGESGLRCEMAAQVEEDGDTLLPLKLLSEIVGSWRPGLLHIESMPGRPCDLILQSDASRSEAKLRGMDPVEYPAFPVVEERPPLILDAGQLRRMIAQVTFAAQKEEAEERLFIFRYVLIELSRDTFQIVAADNTRLALSSCPLSGQSTESILAPARALDRLAALLPERGVTELVVGERHLQASSENWTFWTQLGEGAYPDYQRAISLLGEAKTRVIVPTANFAEAMRALLPFARTDSRQAFLKVDQKAGAVILSAEAADLGSNTCVVDATSCEGESMEMAFNSESLQRALAAVAARRLILELSGPTRPGKITTDPTADGGSTTFTYVLAPLIR